MISLAEYEALASRTLVVAADTVGIKEISIGLKVRKVSRKRRIIELTEWWSGNW